MRTDGVEVDAPEFRRGPGFGKRDKDMLVEKFVAVPRVEALDISVFGRFSGIDKEKFDVVFGRPAQHRNARQLGAIVESDDARITATLFGDAIKNANDAQTREREIDLGCEAFAREVVHGGHRSKLAAVGQRVADKISRPTRVRKTYAATTFPRAIRT